MPTAPKKTPAASKTKTATTAKRARSPDDTTATPVREEPLKRAKTAASAIVVAEQETELTPESVVEPTPVKFSGNFDIYAMHLPFLKKEYLPEGSSTPQFEQLYETILTYQAKNDRTAQCFIPDDTDSDGRFKTLNLQDPMMESAFDICINSIVVKDSITFTPSELLNFVTPKTIKGERGVTAKMELVEIHCGIASASGVFKMTRAWVKAGAEGEGPVELFEGYLAFGMKFSGMYKRKGHGSGTSCKFAFWAVRAKKDGNGKEIGLESIL